MTGARIAERAPGAPGVMQLVLSLCAGGTERLTIEIVKRLVGRYPMVVACLDEPGAWAGEVEAVGVTVVTLGRTPGFHPTLGRRVAAAARAHGVSVVHCHHYSPFVYGTLARVWDRRLRVLYTEHGRLSDARAPRKRRFVNRLLGLVSGPAVTVSAELREHMRADGFAPADFGVVYNGIEIGEVPDDAARARGRQALGVLDHDCVVGTVARLDPVKALPTLVEAIAVARQTVPNLVLAVVGDGPERAAIEEAARRAGITEAVRLLGYRSDIRQLLPGFDLYVNSSISEGISLTILEAMAASVPVVATRVGGTPEVVVDGISGLLVPARASRPLADAVAALARDPDRRARLGAAGRTRVVSAFTIDRMVDDYARFYDRLGRR